MFYCPFYDPYMYRDDPGNSYIRILHASPGSPPVDIYVNNNPAVRNLRYREFSDYIPLPGGIYNIKVFPSGNLTSPVINKNITLSPKSAVTVAAVGRLPEIDLISFLEPKMYIPPKKAMIRFAHLSPDAPPVDITLPDGKVIFKNIGFKKISDYIAVSPGNYTLQARISGTDKIVLTVPNVILRPDKFYTAYAVGLAPGNPPLQLLLPLDGNTYLNI